MLHSEACLKEELNLLLHLNFCSHTDMLVGLFTKKGTLCGLTLVWHHRPYKLSLPLASGQGGTCCAHW